MGPKTDGADCPFPDAPDDNDLDVIRERRIHQLARAPSEASAKELADLRRRT